MRSMRMHKVLNLMADLGGVPAPMFRWELVREFVPREFTWGKAKLRDTTWHGKARMMAGRHRGPSNTQRSGERRQAWRKTFRNG